MTSETDTTSPLTAEELQKLAELEQATHRDDEPGQISAWHAFWSALVPLGPRLLAQLISLQAEHAALAEELDQLRRRTHGLEEITHLPESLWPPRAQWGEDVFYASRIFSAAAQAESERLKAERDAVESEMEEVSFMCETHFRGATGRRMNASEVIRYIASLGREYDDEVDRSELLAALLERIRQWDMLDGTADGPYWKREIDAALAAHTAEGAELCPLCREPTPCGCDGPRRALKGA